MYPMYLNQLIGGDGLMQILSLIAVILFLVFYPRVMLSQIMWKLESASRDLEVMSRKARKVILKELSPNPSKELEDSVSRFFEFFVIAPVNMDPTGIIPKFEHIIQNEKERFDYFVSQVAPDKDAETRANIAMGFAGGITLYDIFKMVRHYVQFIKKTKSMQIAIILQMQLPMIERIAKSMYRGTKALVKGEVVGDGLGPLFAAHLIGDRPVKEIEEDTIAAEVPYDGRILYVIKAKGPGGRLGRPGKAVETIIKNRKIERVITVDAAAKLEGEKTGSVAEGVGVAMGGPGVEKSYIEDIVVKKKIPLDSIIVKMSSEQAIQPMRKSIKDAIGEVQKSLERSMKRTKKGDRLIVVGVGNTSGVGNNRKAVKDVEEAVEKYEKALQERMKKKGKKKKKKAKK